LIPYTFSYSELSDLRQCPHKWQMGWQERWSSPNLGSARQQGLAWHGLVERYWGLRVSGTGPRKAARLVREELLADPPLSPEQELLLWMFEGYVDHWGNDREWIVVEVEQRREVPIAANLILKTRCDLVVKMRSTGRLWLLDSKTGKNIATEDELQFHLEMALYTWGLREAGLPIWGTIYDQVRTFRYKDERKQDLEDRHRRTLIRHLDSELEIIRNDAVRDMQQALIQGWPAGGRGVRARLDQPRHIDSERCRWRCDFRDSCLAGMRGQDERQFMRDLGFTQHI
jgi:hypothetical protein